MAMVLVERDKVHGGHGGCRGPGAQSSRCPSLQRGRWELGPAVRMRHPRSVPVTACAGEMRVCNSAGDLCICAVSYVAQTRRQQPSAALHVVTRDARPPDELVGRRPSQLPVHLQGLASPRLFLSRTCRKTITTLGLLWSSCLATMSADSKAKPKHTALAKKRSNVRSKKEKRDDDVMNVRNTRCP
jgi:hypothetical protein